MKITALIYPGMTALDAMGPLQVWSLWPGAEVQTVWKTVEPLATDSAAVFVPTTDLAGAFAAPDVLFVPGGTAATMALMKDAEILDFLRDRAAAARWTTSVCTGALVLGAAGLLDGRRATTHWAALEMLPGFGAEVVRERWVIDGAPVTGSPARGGVATGGGVTAGIDFALALLAEIEGEETARTVQLALEYAPAPPFDAGSPEAAGEDLARRVRELFAAQAAAG